jgi:glucosylglycerate phosphorylase
VERTIVQALRAHLARLYDRELVEPTLVRLVEALERFARDHPDVAGRDPAPFDEADVWVIAYGDHLTEPGRAPLESLDDFLRERFRGVLGGLHLLPHYPWTSDDGFAVVDYEEVDPQLGDWGDVERLAVSFRLMLDAVVNHTSASSPWFQGWLQDDPTFADFFISPPEDADLDQVVRPRTTPLLTPFPAREGVREVWTTFGPDQVDLNYANPEVLLRITGILLDYVAHGARALRLDAIAFLWKRFGTTCIHLEETHEVIRLWRTVLDAVAPGTLIVTETNVPHAENLSYLGDGTDEAHLVYQFPLPPLVLHAFRGGDGTVLAGWLRTLETPSTSTTFLNFLGSHDGIGLRPVEQLLPDREVEALGEAARREAGGVSY